VTKELIKEFKRVTGKENLLVRVAEGDGSFLTGNLTFDSQEPSEETELGPKRS
jgi:hypothetical protein